jgi:hypothetical protein
MPYIKRALPNIELDIFCKNKTIAKPLSSFRKEQYGFASELTYNLDSNCVERLLKESNIHYGPVEVPKVDGNILCAICPYALLPNKSLNTQQIQKAKEFAQNAGYMLTDDVLNAGWVIGPENFQLIFAASKGFKTSMISTGYSANFYKTMFPNGEILNF